MPDTTRIAQAVLAKAKAIDPHMPKSDRIVLAAWADVFEGQKIWAREALDAVSEHYRDPEAPRLMPGHVLAYCRDLPPWSSHEHAQEFLTHWAGYPYSDTIERYTGIQWPEVTPPDDMDLKAERAWLAETRLKWVQENLGLLTGAILSQRYNPPAIES